MRPESGLVSHFGGSVHDKTQVIPVKAERPDKFDFLQDGICSQAAGREFRFVGVVNTGQSARQKVDPADTREDSVNPVKHGTGIEG